PAPGGSGWAAAGGAGAAEAAFGGGAGRPAGTGDVRLRRGADRQPAAGVVPRSGVAKAGAGAFSAAARYAAVPHAATQQRLCARTSTFPLLMPGAVSPRHSTPSESGNCLCPVLFVALRRVRA